MRVIDADAFWKPFEDEKEELENRTIKTSSALTALKFIDFIKRRLDIQPTILQPERKKGKWINHRNDDGHNIADCDQCGNAIQWFDGDETPRYCCMCGADMRGERNEID